MTFKDHFSTHAAIYRDARPDYPAALYEWLVTLTPARDLAWDAGCGNGQASVDLAAHFDQVVATDPSAEQIANAIARPNLSYQVEPAEQSTLDAASVDLVCVAQALHWFDLARFHTEVRRVLKPGGIVAFWTYADCRVIPAVDAQKDRVYVDLVGPYWPPERGLVETGYAALEFPFERIASPKFELRIRWSVEHYLAYLRSWSASQRYIRALGHDPVSLVETELRKAWGAAGTQRIVRWDFHLHCGRV